MDKWIKQILEDFGALGVGVLMLIENIFPPIPSEVVMPWAGYVAGQGDISFIAVVAAGTFGSFLGAMMWFFVGRWVGKERLAGWIEGHGAWLTITPRDLDRVDDWFERWGAAAVLFCRMVPGVRTLISVPAGFANMPIGRFSLFTAIGTAIWTGLLAAIGRWLGNQYGDLAEPLGWVSTAVIVGLLAWWVVRLIQQQSDRRSTN